MREKKGRGPLLLKELTLTYRNVGNPSRQYGLWESDNDLAYLAPLDKLRGRIGKVSLSHGPEVCFIGLKSAFDKIEGRFMPQRTTRQLHLPPSMLQPDVPLTACLPVSPLDFSPVVAPSVEYPHLEDQSKPMRTSLFVQNKNVGIRAGLRQAKTSFSKLFRSRPSRN